MVVVALVVEAVAVVASAAASVVDTLADMDCNNSAFLFLLLPKIYWHFISAIP